MPEKNIMPEELPNPQAMQEFERHGVEHTARQIGRIASSLGDHMYMDTKENNYNMFKDAKVVNLPGGVDIEVGGQSSIMHEMNGFVEMSSIERGVSLRGNVVGHKTLKKPTATEIKVSPPHTVTDNIYGIGREVGYSVDGTVRKGWTGDKSGVTKKMSLQETRDVAAQQLRRVRRDKQEEKRAAEKTFTSSEASRDWLNRAFDELRVADASELPKGTIIETQDRSKSTHHKDWKQNALIVRDPKNKDNSFRVTFEDGYTSITKYSKEKDTGETTIVGVSYAPDDREHKFPLSGPGYKAPHKRTPEDDRIGEQRFIDLANEIRVALPQESLAK